MKKIWCDVCGVEMGDDTDINVWHKLILRTINPPSKGGLEAMAKSTEIAIDICNDCRKTISKIMGYIYRSKSHRENEWKLVIAEAVEMYKKELIEKEEKFKEEIEEKQKVTLPKGFVDAEVKNNAWQIDESIEYYFDFFKLIS